MNLKLKGYHCWIVNRTNNNLVIKDLNLILRPKTTTDILDYKYSRLSIELVAKSIESGSLRNRLNEGKIYIRQSAPPVDIGRQIPIEKISFPHKYKSNIKFEEKRNVF
jgi:hypothetical protein